MIDISDHYCRRKQFQHAKRTRKSLATGIRIEDSDSLKKFMIWGKIYEEYQLLNSTSTLKTRTEKGNSTLIHKKASSESAYEDPKTKDF